MVNNSLHSIALQALPGVASNTSWSTLDCKLCDSPLWPGTRRAIFTRLWFLNRTEAETLFLQGDHTAYFRYYEAQCSSLTRGRVFLRNQNQDYLLNIIGYLQNPDTEYQSIVDSLLRDYPQVDHSLIRPSIFTAARLWSMLHIGQEEQAVTPGQKPIEWENGTLKQCVQQCFECDSDVSDSVKLPKTFNALTLDEIGNIQIVWTNNLADHLLMRNDDTKVTIFHHAFFLRRHKEGKFNLYEDEFIDETLRTLALLLPESDRSIKKWFLNKKSKCFLDPTARECGNLNAEQRQIKNFKYWRLRLCILKNVFDESEPKSLTQWWNDRRRGERWFTFWIAASVVLLTVFFGLVQSIEGALQVYKAYHPS